MISHD